MEVKGKIKKTSGFLPQNFKKNPPAGCGAGPGALGVDGDQFSPCLFSSSFQSRVWKPSSCTQSMR